MLLMQQRLAVRVGKTEACVAGAVRELHLILQQAAITYQHGCILPWQRLFVKWRRRLFIVMGFACTPVVY
jgi:hypothetical protein